jgi:hypothetical protein
MVVIAASSRLTAAVTLAKQHEPWGLRISQAQRSAFISAAMRPGTVHLPVVRISVRTISWSTPKQ